MRLLTYYKSDIVADEYWKELAATKDTLVFYMSAETVDGIVSKLIKNGVADDTFIAVVEQATTPLQQVHVTNIYDFSQLPDRSFTSPSLVIVGRVVALHEQFAWLTNSEETAHYFKPVAAIQNNLNHNKQAHVSRA